MLWLATLAVATPLEVEADPIYEALSVIAYLAEHEEFCRSENMEHGGGGADRQGSAPDGQR